MWDLTYALAEEIGDPELFVGRKKEMARLLKWADGTKQRISKSMGILSRRKKGKTALLQRFFNILYTRNDPQLIPFYYRIPEERLTKTDFAESFYRRVLTQYFAFTTRTPEMVARVLPMEELRQLAVSDPHVADDIRAMEDILARVPGQAWGHAREVGHRISQLNDVRIIQILDEFQYMNDWIVSDDDRENIELLCHTYMGAAESKFSPQIVAGSYIGWLAAILQHMTARYREWRLESLADDEALEAVYNYGRGLNGLSVPGPGRPDLRHGLSPHLRRGGRAGDPGLHRGRLQEATRLRQTARYRGVAAEYKVRYRLRDAGFRALIAASLLTAQ